MRTKKSKKEKIQVKVSGKKRRKLYRREENLRNLTLPSGLAHPTTGSNRVCSIVAVPHSWSKPDAF